MSKTKGPYYKGRTLPRHVWVPDTQVKPGVDIEHIGAAGKYIADKQPDVIILGGDWWDMPSLSAYEDKGSAYWHDARRTYAEDIEAGNKALEAFMAPIVAEKDYDPRIVFVTGNHEYRIERAVHADPALKGTLTYTDFNLSNYDIEVVPFLTPIEIDGVLYCHYFVNPQSLKKGVLGGTIDNRLNKLKRSFTQGHQQLRAYGSQHDVMGQELHGLVAGAFYSHYEEYQGPQGNSYWRGIIIKNEVEEGHYDPSFVSLDYLIREWGD